MLCLLTGIANCSWLTVDMLLLLLGAGAAGCPPAVAAGVCVVLLGQHTAAACAGA
jgi:hypothetical protein